MGSLCDYLPRRYWLALFLFLCCFNMYTLRVNISIAIQPMSCQYNWTTSKQGMILSSFFFGYIFGNIPGGLLASKYGGKLVVGLGILIPALLTLIIPFVTNTKNDNNILSLNCKCDPLIASNWCFIDNIYTLDEIKCNESNMRICSDNNNNNNNNNIYALMICRILMGIIGSFAYPAIYSLINNWTPNNEKSTMIACSISGVYVAMAITFPISGFIINHSDWQNLFYFFGIIALIWCISWYFYVFDSPLNDPYINKKELKYLKKELNLISKTKDKQNGKDKNDDKIPWKEILTNKVILSLYCCHFSYNWTFYTLLTQLPTYLIMALNYNLSQAGFVSIAPYIGQFLVAIIFSRLTDKIISTKKYSKSNIRKIATTFATVIPSILLVICGYLDNVKYIVILLIISCSLMGFTSPGFIANYSDITDKYSSIIVGVSNSIGTFPGVLSPIFVGYVLQSDLFGWKFIFYITLFLNIVGTSIYCIFGHANLIPKLSTHLKKKTN